MKLQGKKQIFCLLFIILFFLISLYFLIDYLIKSKQDFKEGFKQDSIFSKNINDSNTYSIDMPLTTTYSCSNFCSPTSRCAITGQQCFADLDCPGCNPNTPPYSNTSYKYEVPGNNDAGKLSNLPLQYSPLTTDIGTKSKQISFNQFDKSPSPDFGVNTWFNQFNIGRNLFDERYKAYGLENMPSYPKTYTSTGLFIDEGPTASNTILM